MADRNELHRGSGLHATPGSGRMEAQLRDYLKSRERGPAPERLRTRVAGVAGTSPSRRPLPLLKFLRPAAAVGMAALAAAAVVAVVRVRGVSPQPSGPAASAVPSAAGAQVWQPVAGPGWLPTGADLLLWVTCLGLVSLALLSFRLLLLGPRWNPARSVGGAASARGQAYPRGEATEAFLSLYTRAFGGRLRRLEEGPDEELWTPEEAPVMAAGPGEGRAAGVRSALTGRTSSILLGLGFVALLLSCIGWVYVSTYDPLVPAQVEMTGPDPLIIWRGTLPDLDNPTRQAVMYDCQADAQVRVRFAIRNTAPVSVQVWDVRPLAGSYSVGGSAVPASVLLPPGPTMEALGFDSTSGSAWYGQPVHPFQLAAGQATTLGLVLTMPPVCWQSADIDAVEVHYSVLGFERVVDIPLPARVLLGRSPY